jgi:hypothetical protein
MSKSQAQKFLPDMKRHQNILDFRYRGVPCYRVRDTLLPPNKHIVSKIMKMDTIALQMVKSSTKENSMNLRHCPRVILIIILAVLNTARRRLNEGNAVPKG